MSSVVKGAGGCLPTLLPLSLDPLLMTLLSVCPALPLLPATLPAPPMLLLVAQLPSRSFLASVLLPDLTLGSPELEALLGPPSFFLAVLPSIAVLSSVRGSLFDAVRFFLRVTRGMVKML